MGGLSVSARRIRARLSSRLSLLYVCSIVLFMGVSFNPYTIVTELLDTSLFNVLHVKHQRLTLKEQHHIALCIARGLASLHGHAVPIVHRDMKSLNILVSNDLVSVKICDLGMVKLKAAQGQKLESNGTVSAHAGRQHPHTQHTATVARTSYSALLTGRMGRARLTRNSGSGVRAKGARAAELQQREQGAARSRASHTQQHTPRCNRARIELRAENRRSSLSFSPSVFLSASSPACLHTAALDGT